MGLTGAAVRDFLQVVQRRWRGIEILIVPTRVQGEGASQEIAAAVETVNRLLQPIDVLVVTRGGGSLEDLWAFNEEPTVRAIAASQIPVVSAVGHEIDVTLSDLAADVRALTPSEAAERVVPSGEEIESVLRQHDAVREVVVVARDDERGDKMLAAYLVAEHRTTERPVEVVNDVDDRNLRDALVTEPLVPVVGL